MANDLFRISSKSAFVRAFLVLALVVAVLFVWIAGRRQIGSMLADIASAANINAAETIELAREMSPTDPRATWLKATFEKNLLTTERTASAIRLFEETVRLAPRDFRWWMELGRAYEQADKPREAELALRRAHEIAPTYALVNWQMANFFLRQNREEEAFVALKAATMNNFSYREQAFSLAWDYFEKNPAKLELIVADEPSVYAELAQFYAARGRAEDSIRIWNRLTDQEKLAYPNIIKVIAQGLYDKRFFAQSLEFSRQAGIDAEAQPNTISNEGFETIIGTVDSTLFGWRLAKSDAKLDISPDQSVKRTGARSMRFAFRGFSKPELYNLFQTVVVTPGKSYRLKFWLRTEGLRSAGNPQIEIMNANDDKLLVASRQFPSGTNDWQEIEITLIAPANCSGITIRTSRGFCGDNCPIVGMVWYDDFSLTSG